MTDNNTQIQALYVTEEESEQKLFNFLQRRLDKQGSLHSKGEIHKWIRSGQVRINAKRCKPFDRVNKGDFIRIPPFLFKIGNNLQEESTKKSPKTKKDKVTQSLGIYLSSFDTGVIYEDSELLVYNKPEGLSVHGGSGQTFSLVDLLKSRFTDVSFMPTPAHRLDKDTSGLLLIAKSYQMLRHIHSCMGGGEEQESSLKKVYLAQTSHSKQLQGGIWQDTLSFETKDGQQNKLAISVVKVIRSDVKKSLLEIELRTGRKHQIRQQTSKRNAPIIGDIKYGGVPASRLFLHSYKIVWEGQEFYADKDLKKLWGNF